MLNTNTFYKTFTGTDALAFMLFPETKPILLGSLTTLSHSVYREKKPVPLLGKINTGGFTRGMRSVAGTMVFTLINQHLIEDITTQIPYLKEHGKMKADELPFFDIMVICANEYGSASQMMLYGVEFFEDGQVVSIQDVYIENTFSFIARDIDDFTKIDTIINNGKSTVNGTIDTVTNYDYDIEGYKEAYTETTNIQNKDLVKAQTALNEAGFPCRITGILDNETLQALSKYQDSKGMTSTGYLDSTTYSLLVGESTFKHIIDVSNKNGAKVYSDIDKTAILGIAKYQENLLADVVSDSNFLEIMFYDNIGYIENSDTNLAIPLISYNYKDISNHEDVYYTSLKDLNTDIVGTVIKSNKDSVAQISSLSYYKNGSVDVNTRFYNLNANTEKKLILSYLPEAYIYNLEQQSMPNMIEFIVTADGEDPIKWVIKFKES